MGLCKCPKRKVTNLFCFEHRVNVCENCLVSNHESCVVQSYLSWLTDSDYDPNCLFCSESLASNETVRLKCFHIFHWSCFNARASQLSNTTAPAGYKCPVCLDVIFPAENQVSPVIQKLREKLVSVEWGKLNCELGGIHQHLHNQTNNLSDSFNMHFSASLASSTPNAQRQNNNSNTPSTFSVNMEGVEAQLANGASKQLFNNDPFEGSAFTSRSKISTETASSRQHQMNDDDSKYNKKSTGERHLRTRMNRLPRSVVRIILVLTALILMYFLYCLFDDDSSSEFSVVGVGHKDDALNEDPMFDPHANPNIKIQAD